MIWKLLTGFFCLLFGFAIAWMAFSLFGSRRPARVIDEGRVEFAPSRLAIWAWLFVIGFLATPAIKELTRHQGNQWAPLVVTCFGLAALSIVSSYPETIAATDDGLEQIYWLQKNKRIRWNEIEEIKAGLWGTITVTGKDGTKIAHSIFLADRPRFLQEIKGHCGDELPPDFPGAPMAGA